MSLVRVALVACVVVVAGVVSGVVSGCAGGRGGGGGVDVSQFPSKSEVDAIAARPAPPPAQHRASAVNRWTFVGPFDDVYADVPVDAVNDVERAAAAVISGDHFTKAGRCVAREIAHFLVESGAKDAPDLRWRRYVSARCGSIADAGGTSWRSVTGTAGRSDAEVLAHLQGDVGETLRGLDHDVGVAFARKGDLAVYVAVGLEPEARLEPRSMKAEHGVVELRGTVVDAADIDAIWGHVNQGETGVADCERDAHVALPKFSLRCPVVDSDATAGVSIAAKRRGRFLGTGLGEVIALGGAPTSLEWSASLWGAPAPLPDDEKALAAAFLDRTNGIRQTAGLQPLQDAPAQALTAARLAPHYFAGLDDGGLIDRIALGMLAGWDLTTPVKDGGFSSLSFAGGSLDEVLGAALDSPSGRSVLLDDKAGIAAVGATRDDRGVGLLVTTWEPFEVQPSAVTQSVVFEALKAERGRRGLGGLGEVGLEAEFAKGSARLQQGDDAGAVAHDLLHTTAQQMQRPFTAWNLETSDPAHIAWPDELLTAKQTFVAVAAGLHRRKGSPWATTSVVIVAFVDTQGTVAMNDPVR